MIKSEETDELRWFGGQAAEDKQEDWMTVSEEEEKQRGTGGQIRTRKMG